LSARFSYAIFQVFGIRWWCDEHPVFEEAPQEKVHGSLVGTPPRPCTDWAPASHPTVWKKIDRGAPSQLEQSAKGHHRAETTCFGGFLMALFPTGEIFHLLLRGLGYYHLLPASPEEEPATSVPLWLRSTAETVTRGLAWAAH